jgi:flavin reductase (DIM6/NTAB) family NADH-FMN oxidoreductase RutF
MPSEIANADIGRATDFRAAMRRIATTVTIITAVDQNRHHGMTATAVTSLSVDPPSLLVCINQKTRFYDVMAGARRFCVNVLHQEQVELSSAFAGGVAPEERFAIGDWQYDDEGFQFLANAQAVFFCSRKAMFPFGSHAIFVGEVVRSVHREEVAPLVYENAGYSRTQPAIGHFKNPIKSAEAVR